MAQQREVHAPDRWLEYTPLNKPIEDTRIIVIKTPLEKHFNNGLTREQAERECKDGVPKEDEFTPSQLIEMLDSRGYKLGLVVDLTNTSRYYDKKSFEDVGILYDKIYCRGHEIPSDETFKIFSQILSDFLNDPAHDSEIVAVHCTHGINRSGYLVCRYLVEHCGVDVETAIERFNEARGHNIERKNYLKHLRSGCSATPSYQSSHSNGREYWSPYYHNKLSYYETYRDPYHYYSTGRDPYHYHSTGRDLYSHDNMDRDPYRHDSVDRDPYCHDSIDRNPYCHDSADRDPYHYHKDKRLYWDFSKQANTHTSYSRQSQTDKSKGEEERIQRKRKDKEEDILWLDKKLKATENS